MVCSCPPLSLLGHVLSPTLCCYLALQNLQKFSESAHGLSRSPQPPAWALGA